MHSVYQTLPYPIYQNVEYGLTPLFASQRQQRAEGDGICFVAWQGGLVQDDDPGGNEQNPSYDAMAKGNVFCVR